MPLAANLTVDSTTWAALALLLTVLGGAWSWFAWRRRGLAAGLRGLAWTLVPVAAWLTGTLKLAANILNDVIDWAARLVFSPTVWLGIIVAGIAVALWVASGAMLSRGIGTRGQRRSEKKPKQVRATEPGQPASTRSAQETAQKTVQRKSSGRKAGDEDLEDMDDIEAILRRHGI